MSRHPVTPMSEADLRVHLARQGLAGSAWSTSARTSIRAASRPRSMPSTPTDPAMRDRVSALLDVADARPIWRPIGTAIAKRAQRRRSWWWARAASRKRLIDHWHCHRRAGRRRRAR
jgi:hypothetical protein